MNTDDTLEKSARKNKDLMVEIRRRHQELKSYLTDQKFYDSMANDDDPVCQELYKQTILALDLDNEMFARLDVAHNVISDCYLWAQAYDKSHSSSPVMPLADIKSHLVEATRLLRSLSNMRDVWSDAGHGLAKFQASCSDLTVFQSHKLAHTAAFRMALAQIDATLTRADLDLSMIDIIDDGVNRMSVRKRKLRDDLHMAISTVNK